MKVSTSIALLSALVSTVNSAALLRRDPCYVCQGFTITVSGGVSGTLGQLGDGQNRVYGNYPQGVYTLGCGGQIYDAQGRGCILTPPTTQFQCDAGATPTAGFSLSGSQLLYNGSPNFYACPTGDQGSYNIYVQSIQAKCVGVTLTANGCTSSQPTSQQPQNTCPTTLGPGFEYPHLIVPVDSSNANTAYGTQYFGKVTSTVSSIFNFDIPSGDSGKTCSLVFLFPQQKDLQTSSYTFSGDGNIDFSKLSSVATQGTTYANQPSVAQDYGNTNVQPGNSYVISTFPCPGNTAISFKLTSSSTNLYYFQDYNPSPIGLYITTC